ncbi:MAG TPA: large-conductance mechanosensitive channel protein MscL [Acholeplasmataceae bacterium]|nr:large-conductance mechanosensitive channel protein MscL [Acholeplasmataceae bacterium]
MMKDFKKFALKGNVVDLAIAVIIGGAFGKIVTSLVNDIFMPILGFLTAGTSFKNLKWVLKPERVVNGEVMPEAAILYGAFIQNVVDFLIISLSIYFFIKLVRRFNRKEEAKVEAAPKKPTDNELLTEIRDLLKENVQINTSASE